MSQKQKQQNTHIVMSIKLKFLASMLTCVMLGNNYAWGDATFLSSTEAATSEKNGISLSVTSGELRKGAYYRQNLLSHLLQGI